MASLDYSEIMIGAPGAVFQAMSRRIGELAFTSASLRTGVTASVDEALRAAGQGPGWRLLKLLWTSHSFRQAQEMAGLLRAWDAKLFLREASLDQSMAIDRGQSFHAFVLLR